MEIILYKNTSDANYVDKTLEAVTTIVGDFREEVSVLNPSIMIEDVDGHVLMSNYLYIPILKRYYFIKNVVVYRTDVYIVNCHVDVLMSYKQDFLNLYGYIERNQYEFNPNIADNELVFTKQYDITHIMCEIPDEQYLTFKGYYLSEDENIFLNVYSRSYKRTEGIL